MCERLSDSWGALQFRVIHIIKNVEFQIGWQQLCWQSDLRGLQLSWRAWNFIKLLALLASISKSLRSDIVSKAFDWYNWSWYFATFNYIQILSIYEHSRDQDSLLLTWISNHMPSVGLNYLLIPKLQVLHLRARFFDSICGLDIRTRYSDSIFELDIRTRYSDSIFGLDIRTRYSNAIVRLDSQTRFWHLNFELW